MARLGRSVSGGAEATSGRPGGGPPGRSPISFLRARVEAVGFRCIPHNTEVGGAKHSKHLAGIAVDISTWGMTSEFLYHFMSGAVNGGFTGIGVGKNFVHIDTRKDKSKVWVYK